MVLGVFWVSAVKSACTSLWYTSCVSSGSAYLSNTIYPCPFDAVSGSLQVSVYLQNWSHVLSYVSKAESTPEIAEVRSCFLTCMSFPFVFRLQNL